MKLPILKCLDLSTGHITQSDDRLLDAAVKNPACRITIYPTDCGWIIPIDDETDWTIIGGLSEGFLGLVDIALQNDCAMLCLDRDGPLIDSIPSFDW